MLQGGCSGTPKGLQGGWGGNQTFRVVPRDPPWHRTKTEWAPWGGLWAARGRFGGPCSDLKNVKKPLFFIVFGALGSSQGAQGGPKGDKMGAHAAT